jgi:hypothetical protein
MSYVERRSLQIAAVLDAMAKLLEIQARDTLRGSFFIPRAEPFDRNSTCGSHGDCSSHMDSLWQVVVLQFPACRARRYIDPAGKPFYVILSEFSELSRRIGVGDSECIAWENAATCK